VAKAAKAAAAEAAAAVLAAVAVVVRSASWTEYPSTALRSRTLIYCTKTQMNDHCLLNMLIRVCLYKACVCVCVRDTLHALRCQLWHSQLGNGTPQLGDGRERMHPG
jgi:hypothetical protein